MIGRASAEQLREAACGQEENLLEEVRSAFEQDSLEEEHREKEERHGLV